MIVRYRRAPTATARRVGKSLFLAHSERGTLYRVNTPVAALWKLLAAPTHATEVLRVFADAFPHVSGARLRRDVVKMLHDLVAEGLVVEVAGRPPTLRARNNRRA